MRNPFGSAPIKAEGQAVEYDQSEVMEVEMDYCSEHEVEFEATDAEEVSDELPNP
jgi:hypothetical protein